MSQERTHSVLALSLSGQVKELRLASNNYRRSRMNVLKGRSAGSAG